MMQNREQALRQVADLLEINMEFLGVTGVEDKLQDQVCITIESLRNAGIKFWMLTGDKVETAKCISIMAGMKPTNQDFFEIKGPIDTLSLQKKLMDFMNLN